MSRSTTILRTQGHECEYDHSKQHQQLRPSNIFVTKSHRGQPSNHAAMASYLGIVSNTTFEAFCVGSQVVNLCK